MPQFTASVLSKFPVDFRFGSSKLIYRANPTYDVPLAPGISAYTEYTIPHGLPIIPYIIGTYSDDNFATSYDLGSGPYGNLPTYGFPGYTLQAHAWADATNITIRVISHNTARRVTFRIIGLGSGPPSLIDTDVSPFPNQDSLLLTTDYSLFHPFTGIREEMTTNGLGTFIYKSYNSGLDAPLTMLTFVEEGGKVSYGNTMNTITKSGVNVSTLTKPYSMTFAVEDFLVKTVTVTLLGYV